MLRDHPAAQGQSTIANEVTTLAERGIATGGIELRCDSDFVGRRMQEGLARILAGEMRELKLGNLEARRDWGHAREYVEAMWRMTQAPEPDDYVIGTGEAHSVRDFVALAFSLAGLDYQEFVVADKELYRPAEVNILQADSAKARVRLGWRHQTSFESVVQEMVEADCRALGVEDRLRGRKLATA